MKKKSVIRECKKIVDVKSKKYREYKNKSESRIGIITLLGFLNFFTPISIISTIFQPSPSSVRLSIILFLVALVSDLVVRKKIKKNKYFIQPSEYENKMSQFQSSIDKNISLGQVEEEMNKRKEYVRESVKLIKWFFFILVVAILEKQIRQLFTSDNIVIGYIMAVFIGFIIISYPYVFGRLIDKGGKSINKFNLFIEYCINNGVGVKNYELLNMSIEILKKKV